MVSDRARALVELGQPAFLNVPSIPDLFHFNQPLARRLGSVIGRRWRRAWTAFQGSTGFYGQRKPFEDAFYSADLSRKRYQNAFFDIHKALHPFQSDGRLTDAESIRLHLSGSLSQLGKEADKIGLNVPLEKFSSMLALIPDWIRGIQNWQAWMQNRLAGFLKTQTADVPSGPEPFGRWLLHFLMPALYWQMVMRRTPAKARNKRLRVQYAQRINESRLRLFKHPLTEKLGLETRQQCLQWAAKTLALFQRSSSQVEGRNGVLDFLNRAARRFGPQRLQALTVIHNFDTRRDDGTSPAERLFDRQFPNLFDFVLADIQQIPMPRKKLPKPLDFWDVRH